jgi:hypothetical protein
LDQEKSGNPARAVISKSFSQKEYCNSVNLFEL